MEEDNKDYIINIRVSKETYDKLRTKAKENSESLSSLVRKTVKDSFDILEDIKKDLFGEDKKGNGRFVHYQSVILARDTECYRCKNNILKGEKAFMGETKSGAREYFCVDCFIAG